MKFPIKNTAEAALLACALLAGLPDTAQAGMPSVSLNDLGRMRLNTISFFVAGFLVSAWGIQCLWNRLQRDFPGLPRLTFKTAAGIVFLWGMLFVLVLTMISGARELMTPGAWEKQGLTYKLTAATAADRQPDSAEALALRRQLQLQKLHVALLDFAARHGGKYPLIDEIQSIDSQSWSLPDRVGARYLYVPGCSIETPEAIVAYEPLVYDDRQLVLRADGRVQSLAVRELESVLDSGSAR